MAQGMHGSTYIACTAHRCDVDYATVIHLDDHMLASREIRLGAYVTPTGLDDHASRVVSFVAGRLWWYMYLISWRWL